MKLRICLSGIVLAISTVNSAPATAQIKTLIMPGDVIEAHADTEENCDACHSAFERGKQRALCLDCHDEIAADIDSGMGFHGRDRSASRRACFRCHTDHEGRDADIVQLDPFTFDHDYTNFALTGRHTDTRCESCHEPAIRFRDTRQSCNGCHADDNVHDDYLGTECGDCHTPTGWVDVEFDHDKTGFLLTGKHSDATCLNCHEDHTFQNTPTTCFGCHSGEDIHDGRSGQQCENCHSPSGWSDTSFNHAQDTRFVLDGKHGNLSCGDCHSDDPFSDQLDTVCVSCHLEDDIHDGHFGGSCHTCHVTDEWAFIAFDHDTDTKQRLHGAHESAECTACHIEPIFDVALQSGCNSCHTDDDPHNGTQGALCQDCHNETSWQDNVFFDHGLTRFPLLGAHTNTACDACHDSMVFRDAPDRCVGCHREDDPHRDRFDQDCAQCHNPVDWHEWRFDHGLQTDFVLQGAHTDVACESCHRQSLASHATLGDRCGDCHRADDVHDGEFGFDCGRCHSSDNFTEVRSVQ